jgi:multiple sugar transport system substrate-binding protein
MTMLKRLGRAVAVLACTFTAVTACGRGGTGDDGAIDYWLWDSSQQPAYERCAEAFEAQNPGLRVRFTHVGWADYWSKLTAGFISGTAPDVFTNHLSKYAQFVDINVLYPLDELHATKQIADSDYLPGLAELWKGQDGHRYGAPKDWDTVGFFYNRALTQAAGITDEQLRNMDWNPQDGGSFEKILAHLTVDANGIRGDEPGFDKNNVATYGLAGSNSGFNNFGQGQWSPFTGSTGWQFTNKNPWGDHYNFDDPRFQKTLDWYFGLAKKGYMAPFAVAGNLGNQFGGDKQMGAGKAVMALNGDWMITTFYKITDADGRPLDMGIAPTPVGPNGHRASMFNGLADSVSRQSDNPEAAAKWVAFLAGHECQMIVGESGVVFPARPAGTDAALAAHASAGRDVTPFTNHVKDGTTFLFPVTDNAADIVAYLRPTLDSIYLGKTDSSAMTTVNEQINELLEITGR